MEVVLPNGELLRTGQWAVTDSPSAHCCSNNFGPQIDGLFLQSNLGIVTKLAVAVDPAPKAYIGLIFHAPEEGDIEPLLEAIHQLFREGIMQNHVLINNINHYVLREHSVLTICMSHMHRIPEQDIHLHSPIAD